MANAITALNPEIWKPMVQDYLNNSLVSMAICNTKCESYLSSGDRVNFPYTTDVRIQSYAQGTDLTIDDVTATQDYIDIDQSKAVTFVMDPVQEKQALANYGADLAYQAAFQLRNNIDQTVIASGVDTASTTVAGGTLTSSTMVAKMTDAYAQLSRNNAADGELFAVVDPAGAALLSQTFIANGFNLSDSSLRNGFSGKALGFNVYVSNNLDYTQVLTTDTQPTATDTVTILGVTWTCVADGTTANAGEINIGADVADWKTIVVKALNGTTSTDYTDIATADRRKYQNAQLSAAAFSGDTCSITAYGKISGTETFTAATNLFATETTNYLFGRKGAVSLAIQMQPELYILQEPKQIARNYITHTLFSAKTFKRDADRVVAMSVNV